MKGLVIALTGLSVLFGSSCSVSRRAASSSRESIAAYKTESDSLREEACRNLEENVTEHEVIRETVMSGDSVKSVRVIERTKGRNQISTQQTKREAVRVVRDTVYIERTDTVRVQDSRFTVHDDGRTRASPFVASLKWIFWILMAVGVILIIIRFGWRK